MRRNRSNIVASIFTAALLHVTPAQADCREEFKQQQMIAAWGPERLFTPFQALLYLDDTNYQDRLNAIKEKADAGDVDAQFLVGMALSSDVSIAVYRGRDEAFQKLYDEAEKYLLMATEQGRAEAMMAMSGLLTWNSNYEQAKIEDLQWRLKAAEAGDPNGLYYAGLALMTDKKMRKLKIGDPEADLLRKGFAFIEQAANLGHADAMQQLALDHEVGMFGLDVDLSKAFYWKEKRAELGDCETQLSGARAYELAPASSGLERANPVKARYWYKQAAEQGVDAAARWLARNPE